MDKEEILAKSRKENEMSDEREHFIKMQGANLAYQVRKSRTKTAIFFTIAFAITTVIYLYQFFNKMNVLPF